LPKIILHDSSQKGNAVLFDWIYRKLYAPKYCSAKLWSLFISFPVFSIDVSAYIIFQNTTQITENLMLHDVRISTVASDIRNLYQEVKQIVE
jgi:hypothetical protein